MLSSLRKSHCEGFCVSFLFLSFVVSRVRGAQSLHPFSQDLDGVGVEVLSLIKLLKSPPSI